MSLGTDEATVVEAPRPGGTASDQSSDSNRTPLVGAESSRSVQSSGSADLWLTTPGILATEGATRGRALARLAALVAAAALIAIWIPGAAPTGEHAPLRQWLATTVLLLVVVASAGVAVWYRDEHRYSPKLELAHGMLCVLAILTMCVHLGVFSPAVMTLCLGIYYFGLSDWELAGRLVFATSALGFFILCVLAAFGVLDVGSSVLAMRPASSATLLSFGLVCQVILGTTFWLARQSRRATRRAFSRLERAAQQIQKRDALLDEAQADLDRAMRIKPGAYTGAQVEHYDVGEVIGRGAMGEVYRASVRGSEQLAALKFLQHVVLDDPASVGRFFREADIVARLESPHIVRVLGTGHAPDGAPFIAMEFLEGEDLAQKLRRKRRLGISATLALVEEVSRALTVAEDAGIVHRDLKPQNLFQVSGPVGQSWKILDFGVSKVMASTGTLTQGAAVGTPSYMSPEQARGAEVDHRADVFALGVIAYRCLTGRPAFTGPDMVSTLYNVLHVQPIQPSKLARLPLDVERVLALALAKQRDRRFGSASMLAAALHEAVRHRLDPRLRADADALLARHGWGVDDEDLPRPHRASLPTL
ncbi:MAG: serine/threonine protein kinase [Myxococcales bacterium]|nr:serine/threonine protein kinase [Myxococcales bacterium]